MCSHTCGTDGRCIFTASVSCLNSGGESVSQCTRDPRASAYIQFNTTWPLNTNSSLLFKKIGICSVAMRKKKNRYKTARVGKVLQFVSDVCNF